MSPLLVSIRAGNCHCRPSRRGPPTLSDCSRASGRRSPSNVCLWERSRWPLLADLRPMPLRIEDVATYVWVRDERRTVVDPLQPLRFTGTGHCHHRLAVNFKLGVALADDVDLGAIEPCATCRCARNSGIRKGTAVLLEPRCRVMSHDRHWCSSSGAPQVRRKSMPTGSGIRSANAAIAEHPTALRS